MRGFYSPRERDSLRMRRFMSSVDAGATYTDPYFANVSALLHFNGADGSTTFADETGRVWTPTGNAQIDTAQSMFGGASGLFDGSNDNILAASSADFAYGTGDFTWELFFRASVVASNKYMIDHGSNGGSLTVNAGTVKYYNVTTGTGSALYTGASGVSADTWYHLAVAREAGTTRMFLDGTLMVSAADPHNYTNQSLMVGDYGGTGFGYQGWIDELRITKGVARYTASFVRPERAFPSI